MLNSFFGKSELISVHHSCINNRNKSWMKQDSGVKTFRFHIDILYISCYFLPLVMQKCHTKWTLWLIWLILKPAFIKLSSSNMEMNVYLYPFLSIKKTENNEIVRKSRKDWLKLWLLVSYSSKGLWQTFEKTFKTCFE